MLVTTHPAMQWPHWLVLSWSEVVALIGQYPLIGRLEFVVVLTWGMASMTGYSQSEGGAGLEVVVIALVVVESPYKRLHSLAASRGCHLVALLRSGLGLLPAFAE